MALLVQATLPGGFRYAEPAYYVANCIGRDKITGSIHGKLVCYANEPARRAHKAAIDGLHAVHRRLRELNAELAAIPAPAETDDLDTRTAREMKEIALHVERKLSEPRVRRAQSELEKPEFQPGQCIDFTILADLAVEMIKPDGSVDEAKVYVWLKSRPEFKDAKDA